MIYQTLTFVFLAIEQADATWDIQIDRGAEDIPHVGDSQVSLLRLRGGQASSLEWAGYEKRGGSVDALKIDDTAGVLVCRLFLDTQVRCVEP